MRRRIALVLTFVISIAALCGCGPKSIDEVNGEVYECAQFSALCPEGWSNYPVTELNDSTALSPNYLRFYKAVPDDGQDAGSLLYSNAYINIGHYPPDTRLFESRDIYQNVEDVELEINGVKWKGYTGELAGNKNAELWKENTGEWQVNICLSDEDGDLDLMEDFEIQKILDSLKKK